LNSLDVSLPSIVATKDALSFGDLAQRFSSSEQQVFTSEDRLLELLYQFKINIIQKLIPGLNKPGYEASTTTEWDFLIQALPGTDFRLYNL
jgi:hypothetical protein